MAAHGPFSTERTTTPPLGVGRKVRASVVNRLPGGRYVVRIGHQEWVAESELELAEGAEIECRIVALEPIPRLRLLRGPAPFPSDEATPPLVLQLEGEEVELHLARVGPSVVGRSGNASDPLLLLLRGRPCATLAVRLGVLGNRCDVRVECPSGTLAAALGRARQDLSRLLAESDLVLESFSVARVPSDLEGAELFVPWSVVSERIDWVT